MSSALKEDFERASKRVKIFKTDSNRKLPTEGETLLRYANDVINSYNAYVSHVASRYPSLKTAEKNKIEQAFENTHKRNLLECLEILGFEVNHSGILDEVNIESLRKLQTSDEQLDVHDDNSSDKSEDSDLNATFRNLSSIQDGNLVENLKSDEKIKSFSVETNTEKQQFDTPSISREQSVRNPIITDNERNKNILPVKVTQTVKMTTKIEFHKACAQTFPEVYDGVDPQGAQPFIRKIELLESMSDSADTDDILFRFLKSNLKGRAFDIIKDAKTTAEIKTAIQSKIKLEKSSIIVGRMMALKMDKGGFSDFSNKVEKLADRYKFSLIEEGMTSAKANEMAVEEAVKLCKSHTKHLTVTTALTATKFNSVKEVTTKYISVTQEETQNRQLGQNGQSAFHFRTNGYQNRPKSDYRGNYNRNNQNSSQCNNYNGNSNYQTNSKQNSNNYRGNSRGNYQNGRGSQNSNRRGNYSNFNNRQQNHRSFKCEQGNEQHPPSGSAQRENWRREKEEESD